MELMGSGETANPKNAAPALFIAHGVMIRTIFDLLIDMMPNRADQQKFIETMSNGVLDRLERVNTDDETKEIAQSYIFDFFATRTNPMKQ